MDIVFNRELIPSSIL